jgi:hypothetical protein
MTEKAVADGWYLEGGEWGTDVDINTSTFVSGGNSIEFKANNNAATTIVSDWIPLDDESTSNDSNDRVYEVYALVKNSSTGINKQVRIIVETTDSTKATLNQTVVAHSYTNSANWEAIGSSVITLTSGDSWARIRIDRPSDVDFTTHIDRVYFNPSPAFLHTSIYDPDITGSFTGAWADINFVGAANPFDSFMTPIAFGGGTNQLLSKPGLYSFNADVLVDSSLTAGDMLGIRIRVLNYYLLRGVFKNSYVYGTTLTIPANYSGEEPLPLGVSGVMHCNALQSTSAGGQAIVAKVFVQVIQFAGTGATYEQAHLSMARIPGE